jgi:hypothetical protein
MGKPEQALEYLRQLVDEFGDEPNLDAMWKQTNREMIEGGDIEGPFSEWLEAQLEGLIADARLIVNREREVARGRALLFLGGRVN